MFNILEAITKRLVEAWKSDQPSGRGHSYRCQCERPVFFRNSLCLGCKSPLGYEPSISKVRALEPGPKPNTWKFHGQKEETPLWRHCGNFDTPAGCNWLVDAEDKEPLCVACRLNNTIPTLDDPDNAR